MRRYFINNLAGAARRGQAFDAFIQQAAHGFQTFYLLLLPADDIVQGLQQIFLVCSLYFQFYDSIDIHIRA